MPKVHPQPVSEMCTCIETYGSDGSWFPTDLDVILFLAVET